MLHSTLKVDDPSRYIMHSVVLSSLDYQVQSRPGTALCNKLQCVVNQTRKATSTFPLTANLIANFPIFCSAMLCLLLLHILQPRTFNLDNILLGIQLISQFYKQEIKFNQGRIISRPSRILLIFSSEPHYPHFLVRVAFSSFSRPSHLQIIVLPILFLTSLFLPDETI